MYIIFLLFRIHPPFLLVIDLTSTSRYVRDNQIGHEGASKLGESIAKLTNLSSLDINLR
jgi:hypothetical protein